MELLFTQKTIKPLSAGKSEENEDPKQITQKKELYDRSFGRGNTSSVKTILKIKFIIQSNCY